MIAKYSSTCIELSPIDRAANLNRMRFRVIEGGSSHGDATTDSPVVKPIANRSALLEQAKSCRRGRTVAESTKNSARSGQGSVVHLNTSLPPFFIVCSIALMLATAIIAAGGALRSIQIEAAQSIATQQVRVAQGESLWHLAQTHPIDGVDSYDVIHWIRATNGLSSDLLMVGDVLTVPAR